MTTKPVPEDELDDRHLVVRVLAGDRQAERELYDTHVDRVYRLAYRLTGDPMMAEEAVQETFIRVYTHLENFEGRSTMSTWIHSIALSVVRTGFRKRKRLQDREVAINEAVAAQLEGTGGNVALGHQLHEAIDTLPEEMRTVFIMHDIEGYKHHEIAEILDVAVGTTKSRLSRAREALRAVLDGPA